MKVISEFIKQNRKALGLTQEEFAMRAGLGLRFVRELEQGKKTLRLDKVISFSSVGILPNEEPFVCFRNKFVFGICFLMRRLRVEEIV